MQEPTGDKDDVKARILNVAMEQFAKNGYAGTSIRQICDAAEVNVASVNYYFRSKELLYHDVFRTLFEDFGKPLERIPDKIHDAASWRAALLEYIASILRMITNDNPPFVWVSRLIALERTSPSSVCPLLFDSFFKRGHDSLEKMLRMGLPADVDSATLMIWTTSVMSQFMVFLHRSPPWNELIIPQTISRDEWIDRTVQHILEGITTRLSYHPDKSGKAL
ncbi:MAG: CerR family C-terminal domain-containing protein [Lentisphaerota bacterium]